MKEIADGHIKEMLKLGIIRQSTSLWCFPAVLLLKKNGKMRLVVEYRNIHKISHPLSYPLSDMEEIVERLDEALEFSLTDLRTAYWPVPVKDNDILKTAFSLGTSYGIYDFAVMPFDLNGMNLPAKN